MHELLIEAKRLNYEVSYILQSGSVAEEVPIRLHSRDTDAGGAPELHPAFLRYLGDTSVCTCGRPAQCAPNCHFNRDHVLGHLDACEPACRADDRFHRSTHRVHPNRLKRALRQVRRLNPKAYDLCYMILALHYSFEDATAKLNEDNRTRGQRELSPAEYAVIWVSGASMLSAAY